jgi:cytosine/adenosine deaminase-related metal-dependent hydrolase
MAHDILIRGGQILTMDPALGDFRRADVHVSGDRIVAVGPDLDVPGAELIDAAGKIVLPGLIDGHRHVWQSLLHGVASDWSFPDYMLKMRTMYVGCFDAEDAYLANYVGGLESLDAGVTSVVDHSHLQTSPAVSDGLARGLRDSGVGGVFCYALQNTPDYLDGAAVDADAVRALFMRAPDAWHDDNAARLRDTYFTAGPLRFGIAMPETTAYLPAEQAAAVFVRVKALQPTLVTGHWDAVKKPGLYLSSVGKLVEAGAFPRATLLSHGNHLDDADLSTMAKSGIGLCTCPDTEHGMGLGPLLARRFVELGGAASLGVDITSFAESSMLKQARLLLQAERNRVAEAEGQVPRTIGWPTRAVLDLLTLTGARALGLDHEIGSLTPGKRADLIIVSAHPVRTAPAVDPVATLIFYTDAADIETVMVAGVLKKRDGTLLGVDYQRLGAAVERSVRRIQDRYARLPIEALESVWAGIFY